MSEVDVLCAARGYLDLTFTGLRALPDVGREEFADDLIRSPGGGALNAIGAARLGLRTAGALALGEDEAGDVLRLQLTSEGVLLPGEPQGRTAVSVVLPYRGDRAFVTFDPETPVRIEPAAALCPRRVIYTLGQVDTLPAGAKPYITIGDREAVRYGRASLPVLPPDATVFLNAAEAAALSGLSDSLEAARLLTTWAPVVVVTRGASGAVACERGAIAETPAVDVEVVDTTGAGDLFVAAWAWADTRELDLEARLQWSVLYSGLSVRVATASAGAATLETLLDEGAKRGLTPPQSERLAGTRS